MLEYHSHMSPVNIDIYLHISDIDTVKDNLASRRILHTVKTAQKGALTGARRSDNNEDISLIYGDIDSL